MNKKNKEPGKISMNICNCVMGGFSMIPFDKSAKEIVSQDSGEIVVAAKHR